MILILYNDAIYLDNSKADVLERRSLTSNDYKSIAKTSRSRKRKYWLSKQK